MCTYEQLSHTRYQVMSSAWYQVYPVPGKRGYPVRGMTGYWVGELVRGVTGYQGVPGKNFFFDRTSAIAYVIKINNFNAIHNRRCATEVK